MIGQNKGARPANLRRSNERALLGLLMRLGVASRSDLAKASGMSQPTAGKITAELMKLGIVQEIEEPVSGPNGRPGESAPLGRPGRMLCLNRDQPRFLGIELDVEETRVAALPIAPTAEQSWSIVFATPSHPEAWQKRLRQELKKFPHQDLWGALVSVPGIVDEKNGQVLYSPNLHWSEGARLPDLIREVCGLPVLLVQEIRALALGHLAAHPECDGFLLVDFGYGVGGAIVEGGKLYSSPLPLHGELGHTPVPGNQRICGCGARGCVETLLSRPGMLASFAAAHPDQPRTFAALAGQIRSQGLEAWLIESLDTLSSIIAGALNVLGLRQVVLTGCLNELPPAVTQRLADGIQRGALWARFGQVTCELAPRRRAIGLAAVGLDRLVVPSGHQPGWRGRDLGHSRKNAASRARRSRLPAARQKLS